MLLAYSSDTPIYHYPVATVATMVGCVCVSLPALSYGVRGMEPYALTFGDGYHPQQWVTAVFAHADVAHLAGNLIFLWCFGLVVEGKVGWWRFLLAFLGIGVLENFVTQTLMLGASEGMALGASGAIFGLMLMAVLWAPNCNLNCYYYYWGRSYFFDASIAMFGVGMAM